MLREEILLVESFFLVTCLCRTAALTRLQEGHSMHPGILKAGSSSVRAASMTNSTESLGLGHLFPVPPHSWPLTTLPRPLLPLSASTLRNSKMLRSLPILLASSAIRCRSPLLKSSAICCRSTLLNSSAICSLSTLLNSSALCSLSTLLNSSLSSILLLCSIRTPAYRAPRPRPGTPPSPPPPPSGLGWLMYISPRQPAGGGFKRWAT